MTRDELLPTHVHEFSDYNSRVLQDNMIRDEIAELQKLQRKIQKEIKLLKEKYFTDGKLKQEWVNLAERRKKEQEGN